ncbi:tetratricopeptide repeat protein [Magnetospira sp. QH-2]|uniref:tetratricopeptide repeat protein n=1 Tax=Magnetospira sp. (strain QH-2) TaxID=1288970 RepID=UPI0003E80A8D|nr:tetratricopeptide repeat protein [Magnetospira sp. QH-2]CCQ75081.1 conserved exported protein of unknown function[Include Sel1 repeat] [Magnetospira sp. QH-2]
MIRWIAALVVALSLTAPAQAGVEEGLAALEKGDMETAVKEFRAAAAHGDAEAAYHMGALHEQGNGVKRSETEALKYYRQSAAAGDPNGQFGLGRFYHLGKGWLQKNPDEAVSLYTQAAEKGSIAAQYNLGMMFATGEGVAVAYGSNPDYVKAYKWFNIVQRGVETDEDRAKIQESIDDVKKHMTAGQLERAEKMVNDWWAEFGKKG